MRKNIIERLTNLAISNNSIIHLDLYDTDKVYLMNEFLFSILITKFYGQNEDLFYLPNNIKIKIEIPNGIIDFIEKFPILTLFTSTKLTINKLDPLIVPMELTSNIQIVANYIKAFNEKIIDKKDLYIDKVSSSYDQERPTRHRDLHEW